MLSIPRDLRVTIPGHGIDKINAAYGEGGLDLTTRTVKSLLGTPGNPFRVNHAIAINFKGFRDAVDIVHCVYVDVDRRYYHSNLGVPIGQRYSEIDVQPGYQRLCGQDALSYVRFRHLDNDIVRADRQQDFLREASAQVEHQQPAEQPQPAGQGVREEHVVGRQPADEPGHPAAAAARGLLRRAPRAPGALPPHLRAEHADPAEHGAPARRRDRADRARRLRDRDAGGDPARGPRVPAPARGAAAHAQAAGAEEAAPRQARPRQRLDLRARHRARVGEGDRPPGARPLALQAAGLRAGMAHAQRPLSAEHRAWRRRRGCT